MGTQVTAAYTIVALGAPTNKLRTFVMATSLPLDILQDFGLRILSDSTTGAGVNPIVRTVVLGFEPSVAAQVLPPTISNTSRIESVFVDPANSGRDYILPPIIRANDNAREPLFEIVKGNVVHKRPTQRDALFRSYMAAYEAAVVTGGSGYVAASTKVTFLGGLPPANFNFDARQGFRGGCVRYINIADPGEGYNPATAVLNIQGGGPDGNTPPIPAQGVLVLDAAGRVRSIAIVDMGSNYVAVPDVVITTTTGINAKRPAKLFAVMAEGRPARGTATIGAGPGFPVTSITVTDPGDNYVTVPDILIRDSGGGTGATARARMGLGRIDTINMGVGYFPGTTISITPVFEDFFPVDPNDTQAQAAMFFRFLETALSQRAISPVTSATPVVA
jgi:hypothetical protein